VGEVTDEHSQNAPHSTQERFHALFRVNIAPRGKDRPKGRLIAPKGKGRPFISIYTPAPTAKWERSFALEVAALGLKVPPDIPLDVSIVAVFPRPQFMQKRSKRDGSLLGGWMERSYLHTAKPDADNVAKIVLDAMKDHFDDARVSVLQVHKVIASTEDEPCVVVRIRQADADLELAPLIDLL